MTTPTIDQLNTLKGETREKRKTIKISDYLNEKYGGEDEYTIKSIVSGLDGLLTDLSTLLKAPAKFLKVSSYDERRTLVSSLTDLNAYLDAQDIEEIATQIDSLKPLISKYNMRHDIERFQEFDDYLDNLQKQATNLTLRIEQLSDVKKAGEKANEEISGLHQALLEREKRINELEEDLSKLLDSNQSRQVEAEEQLDTDKERSNSIEILYIEAQAHKEQVEAFSKRVSQREIQLEDQEEKTKNYLKALDEWKDKHEEKMVEALELIGSAKTALEYKTAEGLSAAFVSRYNEAKEDNSPTFWLVGAFFFVAAAVGVGVWVFLDGQATIPAVIGRVSLIPILIAGAWFCAGQYVKLKNIAEDYAYKSVLAKSIVGFSEQLSNSLDKGDDHSLFIQSTLMELHKDPLRTRGSAKNKTEAFDTKKSERSLDLMDKIWNKVKNMEEGPK